MIGPGSTPVGCARSLPDLRDGVKYLQAQERKADMPSLFDLDDLAS